MGLKSIVENDKDVKIVKLGDDKYEISNEKYKIEITVSSSCVKIVRDKYKIEIKL